MYRTLDAYHKTNEQRINLEVRDLANLFFAGRPRDEEFHKALFDELMVYEPVTSTVVALITSLHRARILRELSIASYEVAERKKPFETIQSLLDKLSLPEATSEPEEALVSDSLEELLNATYRTPGLRWRLNALNRSLGSLRKGDFGFVFARPETGKTTFLASEISYMAEQCSGPVLWINNEEVSEKVKSRVYQAALNATSEDLLKNTTTLGQKYDEKLKNKILIPKGVVYHKKEIERLCKKYQPSLIIIDVIDKVTGFAADRDDLMLGDIYQWARELAKTYGPVIGICQADGTGENVRWLTMGHVANAKTSKQAEADWILGIGKIVDSGWENVRFLNISKNKLAGDAGVTDPNLRHSKHEVLIDALRARYNDFKK